MSLIEEIREELFRQRDEEYALFQHKIIPAAPKDAVIGVRTPALRAYARQLAKREDIVEFLNDLPHRYFDEDQLHSFIVSEIRDYGRCIAEVDRFLPYVNNWATCDQLSPKVFGRHREELLTDIRRWLGSDATYTLRFGIGMMMQYFLDDAFDPAYPEEIAVLRSDEYYVNMMIAWYFATALAKQYDAVLPFIEQGRLDKWTHNKAIQKSVESYRITPEQKTYLKGLRRK